MISTEQNAGAAALMAEYNGLDRYPHIQEKLAWLAMHAKVIDVMAQAGCEHPERLSGYQSGGAQRYVHQYRQYMFANDQHETSKLSATSSAGSPPPCLPTKIGLILRKGPILRNTWPEKDGIPTEHRLKAIRMVKDLIGHGHDNVTIRPKALLASSKMMT